MKKPRIRLSSNGWHYWFGEWATGVVDFRTGRVLHDVGRHQIWVGPFKSAGEAYRNAFSGN